MKRHLAAICAFKTGGKLALKGQTAPLTKRGLHEADLVTTLAADITFARRRALPSAKLAGVRVN
jgi:hypothetical protein